MRAGEKKNLNYEVHILVSPNYDSKEVGRDKISWLESLYGWSTNIQMALKENEGYSRVLAMKSLYGWSTNI